MNSDLGNDAYDVGQNFKFFDVPKDFSENSSEIDLGGVSATHNVIDINTDDKSVDYQSQYRITSQQTTIPFSKINTITLNTGAEMPILGLGLYHSFVCHSSISLILHKQGTWKSRPGAVEHAVEFSLENGYNHRVRQRDRPVIFFNTRSRLMLEYHKTEVGQGIKASGVKREDIFPTTKLDNPDYTRPEEALQDSLKKLNTPYLDLCMCICEFKIAVILTP
jgi:hypothetical protein